MSLQSELPRPEVASESSEYSATERTVLLGLAHKSIETALEERNIALIPFTTSM